MPSLLAAQTVMGAEEPPLSAQAKKAADVFSAGVLIFWTLTGCQHPFGEEATQRTSNIMRGDAANLGQLRHLPDARHLVSGMVQLAPEARLLAEQARRRTAQHSRAQRRAARPHS
jgi:serine/threonine-protein kinase/endoribonuclease IRE1